MLGSVEEIEAAFLRVKESSVKAMGGTDAAKERSFEDIFALNNEIGKMGRKQPKTMPKMKELQAYVNLITVGIKNERTAQVREGIELCQDAIGSIRKDFPSS